MEVLDSVVLYEFSPKCDLNIDPTIERVESTVFVTYTCIVGAVNRRDLKTKNGLYQVSLLKADISDLRKWDEVSIVLSEYNNIEDGILQYDPVTKTLNYIYESELLDQKHSGIFLKISRDMGVTWAPPIQLISMDSDNEPAAVLTKATQHKLYFSSDRNSPGTSYAGGEIFVKSFSFDWSRSSKIRLLELGKQMLLMDVIAFEDKTYFLTIKNYFHTPRQLEVLRLQN